MLNFGLKSESKLVWSPYWARKVLHKIFKKV